MLLTELFDRSADKDYNDGPEKHGRAVYNKLMKAGANKDHADEMAELDAAIKNVEKVRAGDDPNRKINSGRDTRISYAVAMMDELISDFGHLVRSSTGMGGHNQRTREEWAAKQKKDPVSKRVNKLRTKLNNDE